MFPFGTVCLLPNTSDIYGPKNQNKLTPLRTTLVISDLTKPHPLLKTKQNTPILHGFSQPPRYGSIDEREGKSCLRIRVLPMETMIQSRENVGVKKSRWKHFFTISAKFSLTLLVCFTLRQSYRKRCAALRTYRGKVPFSCLPHCREQCTLHNNYFASASASISE